ncbi:MAG: hypothetical protein BGN88_05480 [Clostridiales bacterium 43-6]|nr:MAG: hypothetical protein BGN88_05480 [Clostridiales bacterium 43-6]
MYILKNALRNITRSAGRNILIGIIVVAIAISSSVALSIRNSAQKAEKEGLENLNITAQISLDRQALMEKAQSDGSDMREVMQQYEDLSVDDLTKYSKAAAVKDFYYTLSSSINANGTLEPVDTTGNSTDETESTQSNNQREGGGGGPGGGMGGMGNQGDFTILGYSSSVAMTSFINGTSKITSGAVFDDGTTEMVCLISQELATLNSLKVGSVITFENPNVETETYKFTVKGIYENTSTESESNNQPRFFTSSDPANQIYTSYAALKTVLDNSTKVATTSTDEDTGRTSTTALTSRVSATYVLPDAASLETFKTQVTALGLAEYYSVSSGDVTSYEQSLVPLKNLSKFATYFFFVVLGIGGIILIAFNIFNIRERKYEVGVLTAIGMKRGKVALQFVTELFAVTLMAIVIGTAAGAVISVPTANTLLSAQVSAQKEQSEQRQQNFGRPGEQGTGMRAMQFPGRNTANASYIDNINATIDLSVISQLMGIGVLLTVFSSLAGVVFVLRYEPLKILSNRT